MTIHKILYGDVWAGLSTLENNSVDCVITSPPYWSQRNYGFNGQIGLENTLDDYIARLITIFNYLRQKLKPEGVFFLNIGDKYLSKYGNTPLGCIPTKLVYYLVKDGWNLEEILIWYKPNHMPSSVKNRFTNTYEPIFVLSKDNFNYFNEIKKIKPFSNILKVPLQPVPYKHMATYPEKLIETLLGFGLPNDAVILDPFAGSGTTCKAVQNVSKGYFNPVKMKSIMIEANKNYIQIIRKRCRISSQNIKDVTFKPYELIPIDKTKEDKKIEGQIGDLNIKPGQVIVKLVRSSSEFQSLLPFLYGDQVADLLSDDGICFVGLFDFTIEDFFGIALVNDNGWIIRNMLVVPYKKHWFPIWMLVKDIKSVKYQFNLDNIRIEHRSKRKPEWHETDFIGYKVVKPQSFFKKPDQGVIAKILSHHDSGMPKWVVVQWKSGSYSLEEMLDSSNGENNITMRCPKCKTPLRKFHHYKNTVSCALCSLELWRGIDSIPILIETNPRKEPPYKHQIIDIAEKNTKKVNYQGKFNEADRFNLGQSPGARVSVEEQYFSMQRFYNVKQSMISDYFNLHRNKAKLSKTQITEKFPPEYKHTVGHWLRKDMGGSLPKYEDLLKLNETLQIDQSYFNYISRMGLKLQTVLESERGKNPGDFLDMSLKEVIKLLKRTVG